MLFLLRCLFMKTTGLAGLRALVFCLSLGLPEARSGIVAKSYLESIIQSLEIPEAQIQTDWNQTDATAFDYLKNKPTLSLVALSGSYNDLIDKPQMASLYEVRSNSIKNAAADSEMYVEMDSIRFLLRKIGTANYWAARIVNKTGVTLLVNIKFEQLYDAVSQTGAKEEQTLGPDAELNPDAQNADIGYGKDNIIITYMTDLTNMRLYRWTISTHGDKAISVVEKLF